jgi:hypothetical protein
MSKRGNTTAVTKKESTGRAVTAGVIIQQLHGLLQRLREHLKEVQDRAFELVAALSFATVFVSETFSIDGLSTIAPTPFGPR